MSDTLDHLATAFADRYTVQRELGRGGMATVYLAEDLKHHRKVAIKVLRPEQASGEPVDARSDIYSLGCVLCEMLGGDPPFLGTTPQAILARKAAEPAPPLRAVRDTVPEGLEQVVLKSLARTPADRLTTVADFRAALEPASLELAATRPSRAQPRRPWRWIAAVAATAAVAVIAIVLGVGGGEGGTSLRYSSLATLPILNFTGDASWGDQVIGLTAELRTSMGLLSHDDNSIQLSLRSVLRAEAEVSSSQEIAELLGVDLLLEPNLVSTPSGVQLSVELVDGRTGAQLWAAGFNRPLSEINQLNRDIAVAVAAEIGIVVAPEIMAFAETRTVDSVAYRHYLRGRTLSCPNLS